MRVCFDRPLIYLISKGIATDSNFSQFRSDFLRIAGCAVDEQVSLIQIREKRLSARLLFELASTVVALTRETKTLVLVNDRADIAVAAGADGVHLSATSLSQSIIRKSISKTLIIGVSTHSADSAKIAAEAGADFCVFGPVFETPGKGEPKGLLELSTVCRDLKNFPIIGLGGINETNCESVIATGASGVAAIRALNDTQSMTRIANILRV